MCNEVWPGQSSGELRKSEAGCFLPKSGSPFEYMLGTGDCSEWANTGLLLGSLWSNLGDLNLIGRTEMCTAG